MRLYFMSITSVLTFVINDLSLTMQRTVHMFAPLKTRLLVEVDKRKPNQTQ